ncbi:MAG: hypothetical protein V1249_13340, partial [Acidimicrobiales bacterium]|nr:hypothetical protein [Acidimicrobiales bacterium]
MVTISLQANPAGYSVGAVNAVSVQIGGSSRSAGKARRSTAEDAAGAPVVTVQVADAIVTEGGQVVFTIVADPVPTSDLVVAVRIGGDVAPDDYEGIDDTVVIPAGSATVDLVVSTLVDDLREANEDLEVVVSGSFDDAAGFAPQDLLIFDIQEAVSVLLERQADLVNEIAASETAPEDLRVFDLQAEIDDLVERRTELVGELAEAQQDLVDAEAEVSGLESRQQEMTNVEQELIAKGIITYAQAADSDLTPTEAASLISLDEALDDANVDLEAENITVAERTQAFDAYNDALSAALETSSELTTARDTVETSGNTLSALEREDERLSFLLGVAEADLAEAQASTDTVVQDLLDEQRRLEFSLDAKREELRVA